MNNTKKLPDSYAKSTDSKLYKVIQLANLLSVDHKSDLLKIAKSRDFRFAIGETLDNYGEMLGRKRNGATDEQYRIMLLNQIGKNISAGDCNSTINLIAQMLGVEPSAISIFEDDFTVGIKGLTIRVLEESGLSSKEVNEMIQGLMPVGVALANPMYAGTLTLTGDEKMGYPVEQEYPHLFNAWYQAQLELAENGVEIGLSGFGEVPEEFTSYAATSDMQRSGAYNGGTLGILTGDDE